LIMARYSRIINCRPCCNQYVQQRPTVSRRLQQILTSLSDLFVLYNWRYEVGTVARDRWVITFGRLHQGRNCARCPLHPCPIFDVL